MTPFDRRGLAETVAWCVSVVATGAVLIVALVEKDASSTHTAFGLFIAATGALLARGTKGAIDRDAQTQQQDPEKKHDA